MKMFIQLFVRLVDSYWIEEKKNFISHFNDGQIKYSNIQFGFQLTNQFVIAFYSLFGGVFWCSTTAVHIDTTMMIMPTDKSLKTPLPS